MYIKAINHFKKVDPILYKLGNRFDPIILEKSPDLYIRLVRSIIGQQLSVKAASTIYLRFEKLFENSINPEELIKLNDQEIRNCGLSFSKIKYIKDLSNKIVDKELILQNLEKNSDEEIIEELIKVKGIGRWSAEMFLMGALAREDIFSVGDLGLKNAIKKHYKIEILTDEILLEISQKWSPFRTYACRILWKSLDNSPK